MKWFQFIPQFFFDAQIWNAKSPNLRQCNICGFKPNYWFSRGHHLPIIDKYKIIGAGKRHVDCPNCASSDRDRLVFQFLIEQHIHPQKILHIAPEKPLFDAIKSKFNCEIIGLDNRSKGYKFAYSREVIYGDLRKLQFKEETFDWVICNHVLEHVVEEELALNEIKRVLKVSGKAIVQIPFSPILNNTIEADPDWNSRLRETELGQWDHVRLYGIDFVTRWKNWGIHVELKDTIKSNTKEIYHLNGSEPIVLIQKN